jgi:hypothetical protein
MNPRNALDAFYYWNRIWRTQVYFNARANATVSFRDKNNPH